MSDIVDKIAKLLRLAKDREGTPEGDTVLARAQALADAHGIPIDECEATVPRQPLPAAKPLSDISLSPDQAIAIDRIMEWLCSERQILTLGGLAGTGKSTLMNVVVSNYGGSVATCAYTGKAAHVLRTKGMKDARTIHSLIYEPVATCTNCGMEVDGVGEEVSSSKLRCKQTSCYGAPTETTFLKVVALPFDLVIVDEASMVSTEIHHDLISFGVKILYVGDHGQLEPIGNNPRLLADPEIRLEQIHRQAEGSSILRFAHNVRQHMAPKTEGEDAVVIESTSVPKNLADFDVVLCGRNVTRVAVNAAMRRALGYHTDLPLPGERVVCLRNLKKHNIFNGMTAEVVALRCDECTDRPEIDIRLEDGSVIRSIHFEPAQFGCPKTLTDVSRKVALFDFGYCLTVMKSQGSSWDSVLVLEWIHGDDSAARWRYTAATRARKRLVWCMRPSSRRA